MTFRIPFTSIESMPENLKQRAKQFVQALIDRGFPKYQIESDSQGVTIDPEDTPLSVSDTEDGQKLVLGNETLIEVENSAWKRFEYGTVRFFEENLKEDVNLSITANLRMSFLAEQQDPFRDEMISLYAIQPEDISPMTLPTKPRILYYRPFEREELDTPKSLIMYLIGDNQPIGLAAQYQEAIEFNEFQEAIEFNEFLGTIRNTLNNEAIYVVANNDKFIITYPVGTSRYDILTNLELLKDLGVVAKFKYQPKLGAQEIEIHNEARGTLMDKLKSVEELVDTLAP